MSKIIIGFTGPIASGKEVAKKYLEEKYGANSHRFSTMLRDILNRLYIPLTRTNLQDISTTIRGCFGDDTMANVISEDVKNDNHDIVVVEGIRRLADIGALMALPNFFLISIEADSKIRYQRLIKRNENDGDSLKTYEDFLADHQKETETQIESVMAAAKFHLNNDGSLEDLYNQIEKIISLINK